jgi:hypothetical protein
MLGLAEVCAAAGVGPDSVNRAVFLTRKGRALPGDPNHLPRAMRIARGFARADVLRWIAAREAIASPAMAPLQEEQRRPA